jgi:hypothetical protein
MLPECDERRSHKKIAQNDDEGQNSRPPLLKRPAFRANGNLEEDCLESPSNGQGNEEADAYVNSKQIARNETDDGDKDVADERAPKGGAQRELDTANQSTQQEQQDHANRDGNGSITNKHRAAILR